MKISCIITDDEDFAIRGLKEYVSRISYLELVQTCQDALELDAYLKNDTADLIFLDIHMPELSGIEFLRLHPRAPAVILTTAYPDYALESYELNVLDYLLKPISFERFYKSVQKASDYLQARFPEPPAKSDYIFLKCKSRLEKIFLKEILWIESRQNYVLVNTASQQYVAHYTLKSVRSQIPEESFVQIHQSFLVALAHIEAIEGNQVLVKGHKLPISKHSKAEVMEQILNQRLLKRD